MSNKFKSLLLINLSPKNEMLYRVFKAMVRDPSKGDWIELVKKDLIDFNINLSFEEIGKMKVDNFKNKVKEAGRINIHSINY